MIPCQPSPTPTPTVTEGPPPTWRNCTNGQVYDGTPPVDYRSAIYQGPGGGVCWTPTTQVGFVPNLQTAVEFTYRRNSGVFPPPVSVTAQNPSPVISYRVTINTDTNIQILPTNSFNLGPNENYNCTIGVNSSFYEQLGDGQTDFRLDVEVVEL
jgi:hypothetical protein